MLPTVAQSSEGKHTEDLLGPDSKYLYVNVRSVRQSSSPTTGTEALASAAFRENAARRWGTMVLFPYKKVNDWFRGKEN